MKNYLTVKQNVQNEIIIEKSRFITSLKRVYGEDDAKAFVQGVKSEYPDATHNCYAYVADEGGFFAKFSDDGEPQSTAGLPMLETIKAKGLKQVAVVVTRYFGGVKLGTGGLARAYADCVKKAIDKAGIKSVVWSNTFKSEVSYAIYPKIVKIIEGCEGVVTKIDYLSQNVELTFSAPVEKAGTLTDKIIDYSAGKCAVLTLNEGYFEYDLI